MQHNKHNIENETRKLHDDHELQSSAVSKAHGLVALFESTVQEKKEYMILRMS